MCVCVCVNWQADSKIPTEMQGQRITTTFKKNNKVRELILFYIKLQKYGISPRIEQNEESRNRP